MRGGKGQNGGMGSRQKEKGEKGRQQEGIIWDRGVVPQFSDPVYASVTDA
jgi:hypothetical protein